MHQPGPGQPAFQQSRHPRRAQPPRLAAPVQRMVPVSAQPFAKSVQARPVPRHRVVLVKPGQHPSEPFPHRRHRVVHPLPKRLLHLLQFRFQLLPRRLPPDDEIPATVRPASMREPQKRGQTDVARSRNGGFSGLGVARWGGFPGDWARIRGRKRDGVGGPGRGGRGPASFRGGLRAWKRIGGVRRGGFLWRGGRRRQSGAGIQEYSVGLVSDWPLRPLRPSQTGHFGRTSATSAGHYGPMR
jgi:hypothetical protein